MILEELKFHHIGIAVNDFEPITSYYHSIGYKQFNKIIIRDELQVVDLILLTHDTHPSIELVKPINNKSPINNYLKSNDVAIYHFCYEVDSFTNVINKIKENFRVFNVVKPKPAILFNNRIVAFYYVHGVGLIELLKI